MLNRLDGSAAFFGGSVKHPVLFHDCQQVLLEVSPARIAAGGLIARQCVSTGRHLDWDKLNRAPFVLLASIDGCAVLLLSDSQAGRAAIDRDVAAVVDGDGVHDAAPVEMVIGDAQQLPSHSS